MIRIDGKEYRVEDILCEIALWAARSRLLSPARRFWEFWYFVSLLSEDYAWLDIAKTVFVIASFILFFTVLRIVWI